jgi:hypothetical protein
VAYSVQLKHNRKAFTATWTGFVTPPRTGQFVFSICPINVNKEIGNEFVRNTMEVWIDRTRVVSATPAKWQWGGSAVQLTAGHAVPIRIEVDYQIGRPTNSDSPHAFLYWEGPGLNRQIVPGAVLTPPNGDGQGLEGVYRWIEKAEPKEVIQRNSSIEFAWSTSRSVAPRHPELIAQLTERLWKLSTDTQMHSGPI